MKNLDSDLITLLKAFIKENEIQVDNKIDSNSRLFVFYSVFDSM